MSIKDNTQIVDPTKTKVVNSRIALKIDTWENWNKDSAKSLVLHAGEVAFVQMGTVPPIGTDKPATGAYDVLFKVGDGTTTFENLPWGSAKAADVHGWAKVASANLVEISYGSGQNEKKSTLSAFLQAFETYKTSNDQAIANLTEATTDTSNGTSLASRLAVVEGLAGIGGEGSTGSLATVVYVDEAIDDAKEELIGESTVTGVVSTIKAASAQAIAAQSTADEAKTWINNNKTNLETVSADPVTKNDVTQAISNHNTTVKHITENEMNKAISDADAEVKRVLIGADGTVDTIKYAIKQASEAGTAADVAQGAADAAREVADRAEGKVDTLIGTDVNKSVREIANAELAAQLLTGKADADFKTLQSLAAWLEDHPEDVAELNRLLSGLGKTGEGDNAPAKTVKEYVDEAVNAEGTARATAITTAINALDITKIEVAAGKTVKEITETNGIVNVTTQDIAITKSQITDFAHNHDNDYAAKTPTDQHIANGDIHVTKTEKDSWNSAAPKAESAIQGVKVNGTELTPDSSKKVNVTIETGTTNGNIKVNGTDVAVKGLGSAAYTASTAYASSTEFGTHTAKAITTETYLLIDCGSSTTCID
mgnify:CR=1 FL=1